MIDNPYAVPLRPEEIPEEIRNCYDYDSQRLEPVGKLGINQQMRIDRYCKKCGERNRIIVTTIRKALKVNVLTGCCIHCAITNPRGSGENSYNWKGGRTITDQGYVGVYVPNHPKAQRNYVLEHRLVMEKHLGRYLLPTETIHHKNGDRQDNRLENLELHCKHHGMGQRYEDLNEEHLRKMIDEAQNILTAKRMEHIVIPPTVSELGFGIEDEECQQ